MKQIIKKTGKIVSLLLLSLFVTQYVSAASYTATNSYTLAVGPGKYGEYSGTMNAGNAGYRFEIKDPFFWHKVTAHSEKNLKKSKSFSGSSNMGSKKAYWRGWVENGKITVTV